MTPEKRAFLTQLLQVTIQRMEYGKDVEWEMNVEGEEDEEQLKFVELRHVRYVLHRRCAETDLFAQSLKMIAEAVASIDHALHVEASRLIAITTLDILEAGGAPAAALSWQRIELALYLVYRFGQCSLGYSRTSADSCMQAPPLLPLVRQRSCKFRRTIPLDRDEKATTDWTTLRTRSPFSAR